MYQHTTLKTRYRQQWAFLTRRLKRWLNNGDFSRFSQEKQQYLRERLGRIYRKMLRFQTASQLRKALGVTILFVGLGAISAAQAQVNFAPPVSDPFGLFSAEEPYYQTLADLDGDGDLDIFSLYYAVELIDGENGEQAFRFRENIGGPPTPNFAAPVSFELPIALVPGDSQNYLTPEFADLDGDGDLDLMFGLADYYGASVVYFENTGDAQNPAFAAPQVDPFEMNFADSEIATPRAADFDGDGDLDLLSSYYEYGDEGAVNGIIYVENTGSQTTPAFGPAQRGVFNLPMTTSNALLMDLGDIDNDGDIDILANPLLDSSGYGSFGIPFTYLENTGDVDNPNFAAPVANPFGLVEASGSFLLPLLGDLDKDGDLDVLSGNNNDLDFVFEWVYQENLLLTVNTENLTFENEGVQVFPRVSAGQYQLQLKISNIQNANLRIYDATGQLLQQSQLVGAFEQNVAIDLSYFPAGLYFLEVQQGPQRWSTSVVKK